MAEVEPVPGAHLDHSSREPRQHLPALLARAGILHPLAHAREHAREDGMRSRLSPRGGRVPEPQVDASQGAGCHLNRA